MNDGLKDAHRSSIIDVFRANSRVERAVLFGSRAMQNFTESSDIDIALFGKALTITDHGDILDSIEETTVPQRVDLLLFDKIEEPALRNHICQRGIELYRKQAPISEK